MNLITEKEVFALIYNLTIMISKLERQLLLLAKIEKDLLRTNQNSFSDERTDVIIELREIIAEGNKRLIEHQAMIKRGEDAAQHPNKD